MSMSMSMSMSMPMSMPMSMSLSRSMSTSVVTFARPPIQNQGQMFRDDELVFRDEWFLEALALENEGGASGVQVWPRPLRTMQALFRTSWDIIVYRGVYMYM